MKFQGHFLASDFMRCFQVYQPDIELDKNESNQISEKRVAGENPETGAPGTHQGVMNSLCCGQK